MTTDEDESESYASSDDPEDSGLSGVRGRMWMRGRKGDYDSFHNVPGEPSPIGMSSQT